MSKEAETNYTYEKVPTFGGRDSKIQCNTFKERNSASKKLSKDILKEKVSDNMFAHIEKRSPAKKPVLESGGSSGSENVGEDSL